MQENDYIDNLIMLKNAMYEYQKQNNITKQCVTNTQYLFDSYKASLKNRCQVKVKAVIVSSTNESMTDHFLTAGHVVVAIADNGSNDFSNIIEPSYEINCRKNIEYYDNVKDFIKYSHQELLKKYNMKVVIKGHIDFTKIAEKMNNGELCITDRELYHKQADYVESIFRNIPSSKAMRGKEANKYLKKITQN